jgi:hypothetical protein
MCVAHGSVELVDLVPVWPLMGAMAGAEGSGVFKKWVMSANPV